MKRVPAFSTLAPLLQAVGFAGIKFTKLSERGQPVPIHIHDWQALNKSSAAFTLIESDVQPIVCGNHRVDL